VSAFTKARVQSLRESLPRVYGRTQHACTVGLIRCCGGVGAHARATGISGETRVPDVAPRASVVLRAVAAGVLGIGVSGAGRPHAVAAAVETVALAPGAEASVAARLWK